MERTANRSPTGRTAGALAAALLAAAAANVAYVVAEPLAGLVAEEAAARALATALAGATALAAGVLVSTFAFRLPLVVAAVVLLAVVGVPPAVAIGAPLLLALLAGLARDVAEVTRDLPGVRARLLVFVAVALAGPPTVALAHLFL